MKKKIDSKKYIKKLNSALTQEVNKNIEKLAVSLNDAWKNNKNIFLCGNGGSAANAMHIANDLIYGAGVKKGKGLKAEALSSNSSVLTCLANDIGYENIFLEQLKVKASNGDILIVLSGSGNSQNVIHALDVGNKIRMKTFAILGFSGGRCKELAQNSIHFEIEDMQISEDLQLIVGHMCMQWLAEHGKGKV